MQATLTDACPFQTGIALDVDADDPTTIRRIAAIRRFTLRVAAIAGFVALGAMLAPTGEVLADDDPLPGAPAIRTSDQGVVNAGPSEVRVAQRGETRGGVTQNSNGGGLVKDGNQFTPGGLPSRVGGGMVCGNIVGGFSGYAPVIAC